MTKLKNKIVKIGDKKYILVEHLKDGGNGSIWKARNGKKEYAIKILNKKFNSSKERFKKEIEFCEYNKHDNLIPIYGNGEIDDKLCYIMPLYENNLSDLINKGIDVEKGFKYVMQICNVLEFLHKKM